MNSKKTHINMGFNLYTVSPKSQSKQTIINFTRNFRFIIQAIELERLDVEKVTQHLTRN